MLIYKKHIENDNKPNEINARRWRERGLCVFS